MAPETQSHLQCACERRLNRSPEGVPAIAGCGCGEYAVAKQRAPCTSSRITVHILSAWVEVERAVEVSPSALPITGRDILRVAVALA